MGSVKRSHQLALGDTFGRLTIIGPGARRAFDSASPWYYPCKCACGAMREVAGNRLVRGEATSCGCYRRDVTSERSTTHGGTHTLLYRVYQGMIARCTNPANPNYPRYGARGIGVCDEWRGDFAPFQTWARATGYRRGLQLDRKDNDSGYSPDNCRWATPSENSSNRRDTRLITAFGETKTLTAWARDTRCAVSIMGLSSRLNKGVPAEVALTAKPTPRIPMVYPPA